MDKIHQICLQYRNFLIERRFSTAKVAEYMRHWVEQFLHFALNHRGEEFEQVLARFEATLEENASLEPWLRKQANDAITLYHYHFRHAKAAPRNHSEAPGREAILAKLAEKGSPIMLLFLDTLDTAPIQRNHFAHENIRPRVHGRSHF